MRSDGSELLHGSDLCPQASQAEHSGSVHEMAGTVPTRHGQVPGEPDGQCHLRSGSPTYSVLSRGTAGHTARPEPSVSLTCVVRLLLQAPHVQGAPLLDEVQELDGVGHPQHDVLQLGEQAGQGEAGRGHGLLAAERHAVTLGPPLLTGRPFQWDTHKNYDLSADQGEAGDGRETHDLLTATVGRAYRPQQEWLAAATATGNDSGK